MAKKCQQLMPVLLQLYFLDLNGKMNRLFKTRAEKVYKSAKKNTFYFFIRHSSQSVKLYMHN